MKVYKPFSKFILRTPTFPFNNLINTIDTDSLNKLLYNGTFIKAIYIASPDLYYELIKYRDTGKVNDKQNFFNSVIRYFTRMSTRCTPFGLFSSCSVGKIDEITSLTLSDSIEAYTRLDMYYLCGLADYLTKKSEIKLKLKYYTNTSLYTYGNKYRYIEYKYQGEKFFQNLTEVNKSVYLKNILLKASAGAYVADLVNVIKDEDITEQDALGFIEELIESEILVSELNPQVTGDDFLGSINNTLKNRKIETPLTQSLANIGEKLMPDMEIEDYINLSDEIKKLPVRFKENHLFQVDSVRKGEKDLLLGKDIIDELQATMLFLNKITGSGKQETLSSFQQSYYSRYEDREMPLLEVLDPELGIGYPANVGYNESPLLAGLKSPVYQNDNPTFKRLNLLEKGINKEEIVLTDKDVEGVSANWDDLPATLSVMFEVVSYTPDNFLLKINSMGSSGKLIARFAYTNPSIYELLNEIAVKEKEFYKNAVLAEIAHLPESRVGNVLTRPHIRDYEITYLAYSGRPVDEIIHPADLYISVKQGRIVLRSKKLNKEIIPCLTNAHNYRNSTIPIYRFLCDMQYQQGRGGLYFNIGFENTYLPRVRYRNSILALATWQIEIKNIKHLFSLNGDNLLKAIQEWRKTESIPQQVVLVDGDNKLFIDWESESSIKSAFSIIKKRTSVKFEEFLTCETPTKSADGTKLYTNEFIVSFYRD